MNEGPKYSLIQLIIPLLQQSINLKSTAIIASSYTNIRDILTGLLSAKKIPHDMT